MRIWLAPITHLSDQHLLGQHQEWHMLENMIRNPRFKNHKMTKFFADKQKFLAEFHEKLVRELDYRFNHLERHGSHPSPIPKGFTRKGKNWTPSNNWIHYDKIDLAKRYMDAPPDKYTWTKRKRPKWTYGSGLVKRAKLGPIPAHEAGAKLGAIHHG